MYGDVAVGIITGMGWAFPIVLVFACSQPGPPPRK